MKLLFMINAYSLQGQNSRIVQILGTELAKQGCDVSYLFHVGTRAEYRKVKGSRQSNLFPFYFCLTNNYTSFIERLSEAPKFSLRFLRETAAHPYLFSVALKRKVVEALGIDRLKLSGIYKKKLEQLYRSKQYDAVIAVSNPFDTPTALAQAKIPCIKAHYQIDPYAYNNVLPQQSQQKRLAQEIIWLRQIDKTILPQNLYAHALQHETGKYIKNPLLLDYPLVRDVRNQIDASIRPAIQLNKNQINVLFLGALNLPIRDPHFLFALFTMIEDTTIHLHIIGSRLSDEIADETTKASKGRILFHRYVPQQEAFALMRDADILLNLGNSDIHQLPSKILDYISFGKPIINIYKKAGCPTLNLMKEYPYAYNIFENMDDIKQQAAYVTEFCRSVQGKNIPFEQVSALYAAYTPQFVAQRFLQYILE